MNKSQLLHSVNTKWCFFPSNRKSHMTGIGRFPVLTGHDTQRWNRNGNYNSQVTPLMHSGKRRSFDRGDGRVCGFLILQRFAGSFTALQLQRSLSSGAGRPSAPPKQPRDECEVRTLQTGREDADLITAEASGISKQFGSPSVPGKQLKY